MKYEHKRGNSFELECQLTNNDGSAADLTGMTIRSQIRDSSRNLIDELAVVIVDAVEGQYTLEATSAPDWPVTNLYWDIEYTDAAGKIFSTETITILVKNNITELVTP